MERRLNLAERHSASVLRQPANAMEKIEDLERFGRLLGAKYIDRKKLWGNVEMILQQKSTATLLEVIEQAGLEHGCGGSCELFQFPAGKSGSRTGHAGDH
ncbi:hypothetical protein ACQ86N_44610 [Puia sp. P3]|uniref:hypothetical protein n=1 Tax=Puia sp. P3 TaxID=3423952 RepID=UPI003D66E681